MLPGNMHLCQRPAAFGRLCVETNLLTAVVRMLCQPPSGGCVLKQSPIVEVETGGSPAAFGRLCVETGVDGIL